MSCSPLRACIQPIRQVLPHHLLEVAELCAEDLHISAILCKNYWFICDGMLGVLSARVLLYGLQDRAGTVRISSSSKKTQKTKQGKKNKWETGVLFGCFHCFFKSNKIAITCHIPILMHPLSPFIRDALIHVCRFSLV